MYVYIYRCKDRACKEIMLIDQRCDGRTQRRCLLEKIACCSGSFSSSLSLSFPSFTRLSLSSLYRRIVIHFSPSTLRECERALYKCVCARACVYMRGVRGLFVVCIVRVRAPWMISRPGTFTSRTSLQEQAGNLRRVFVADFWDFCDTSQVASSRTSTLIRMTWVTNDDSNRYGSLRRLDYYSMQ